MHVEVIASTPDPVDVCSRAAGTCCGEGGSSLRRLQSCLARGHMSVFEHAGAMWRIEDVSRACFRQLARNGAACCVHQGQRRCKVGEDHEAVVPPSVAENGSATGVYESLVARAAEAYVALLALGVPAEDARYVLPQGTVTEITIAMSARDMFEFFELRIPREAQWEIRDVAVSMMTALEAESAQWAQLLKMLRDR